MAPKDNKYEPHGKRGVQQNVSPQIELENMVKKFMGNNPYIQSFGKANDLAEPYFKMESLKLYEGPDANVKLHDRTYYSVFNFNYTRYVWVELNAKNLIKDDFFLLTYGDSLTNFNLEKCFNLMGKKNANMSISTFQKKIEYGILDIDENSILKKIHEKTFSVPINAGFYILNKKVFDYIKTINESFEIDILPRIILDKSNTIVVNELNFWHPMDTPEDREKLNKILLNNPNKLIEN